jgi:hypothetical protein
VGRFKVCVLLKKAGAAKLPRPFLRVDRDGMRTAGLSHRCSAPSLAALCGSFLAFFSMMANPIPACEKESTFCLSQIAN